MFVISTEYGGLANRLWQFSHAGAFGLSHGHRVYNACFNRFASYFEATHRGLLPCFPGPSPWWSRLLPTPTWAKIFYTVDDVNRPWVRRTLGNFSGFTTLQLDWAEKFDASGEAGRQLGRKQLITLNGWLFRDDGSLLRHQASIREFFQPTAAFRAQLDALERALRADGRPLIGLHIRHGDYRQHFPQFYHPEDAYRKLVDHLLALPLPLAPKVLIASNNTEFTETIEHPNVARCPNHELLDLYLLARCDYIVGPPSTYSLWAAFHGEKPFYWVKDAGDFPQIVDFRRYHEALDWKTLLNC